MPKHLRNITKKSELSSCDTNEYASRFNKQYILETVLMNEDPCVHAADFPDDSNGEGSLIREMGIPVPEYFYSPQQEHRPMKVVVSCPVCKREYKEAGKRVKKGILHFMSSLSECSMLDEVSK